MFRTLIISFFSANLLAGCVSVSLGPGKAGRAANVKLSEPASPFQKLSDSNSDSAWQSSKTSNTISYFSECPQSDAPLEAIADEFSTVLRTPQVVERKTDFFNGREALWTQAEGKLDGIEMKLSSVVFRRNGCSYLISYVARKGHYKTEYELFTQFLAGFHAP